MIRTTIEEQMEFLTFVLLRTESEEEEQKWKQENKWTRMALEKRKSIHISHAVVVRNKKDQ